MSLKKLAIFIVFSFVIVLMACSGPSTQELIYEHLEKAVSLEEEFEKQQEQINELEKQEQEIYGKIIDLKMDEFDQIKALSKEAIEIIEKRSDKIVLEKESIDASHEEFTKIKDLIDKLDEQEVKDKANEMYDVMIARYNAYEHLYDAYTKSLDQEKELYTLLQNEDVTQEDLTTHIAEINKSYEEVINENKKFNEDTTIYNDLKKEFYELAKLDVQY